MSIIRRAVLTLKSGRLRRPVHISFSFRTLNFHPNILRQLTFLLHIITLNHSLSSETSSVTFIFGLYYYVVVYSNMLIPGLLSMFQKKLKIVVNF